MTNKKLVWRLKTLPTTEELTNLVKDKIITQEEAREILFSSETEEDRNNKSLQSEIKFLRELVEKLSKSRTEIITTIREIEVPYKRYSWYNPYIVWCTNNPYNFIANSTSSMGVLTPGTVTNSFSDIKTF